MAIALIQGTGAVFDSSAGRDKDAQGFGLPPSVCVGGIDLTPPMRSGAGMGSVSARGPRQRVVPQNKNIRLAGGPPPTASAFVAGPDGHLAGTEDWIPGRGGTQSVPVKDSGPLGCAGGDYNKNLDYREA